MKPGYSIARVPGPSSPPFVDNNRPFLIIPIQISGNPAAEGLPLSTKSSIYIHKDRTVHVKPKIDILFIVTSKEDAGSMKIKKDLGSDI